MSIDDIGRAAGRDLRSAFDVDVETALGQFERAATRQQRQRARLAVALAAAVLVLTASVSHWLGSNAQRGAEPIHPSPTAPTPTEGVSDGCDTLVTACLGGRTYTVYSAVPMTWTVPPGFGAPYSDRHSDGVVESYSRDGRSGVSVFYHVSASTLAGRVEPSVVVARDLVRWMARRPFVSTSDVREIELGGYSGWEVDITVPQGSPSGPATCRQQRGCYPLMVVPGTAGTRTVGVWPGVASRYVVLDIHGSGITVVWAWARADTLPTAATDLLASVDFE